jgi:ribosomal protein S18 acetylase RimI-like enzyme
MRIGGRLHLRPATPDDIPALHRLVEHAYRGEEAKKGWTHEADLLGGQRTDEAGLAEIIAGPDRTLLLVHEGDALAGCVLVTHQADGSAYLGMLSVDPERQAAGLGRRLMAGAEAFAVETLNASRMDMTVIRQREELIAWYERRGYALTGETRPFPLDDERFGLPKRRDLEFVVMAKDL